LEEQNRVNTDGDVSNYGYSIRASCMNAAQQHENS